MKKAVIFNQFSYCCPYFNTNTDVNNGYGCDHPKQEEADYDEKMGKNQGMCFCFSCPLGIEAEQMDISDRDADDAIKDEIDWDGLCADGVVTEGEYLLIQSDKTASEDERKVLANYEKFLNQY